MKNCKKDDAAWGGRGKSIRQFIKYFKSFENQDLEVRLSINHGDSHEPISLVGKGGGGSYCLLMSAVSFYNKKAEQSNRPEWVDRGKTIQQLIEELKSFENQDLEVRISMDYGDSHQQIDFIEKNGDDCLLVSATG